MGNDLRYVWAAIILGGLLMAYQSFSAGPRPAPRERMAVRHVFVGGAATIETVTEKDCRKTEGGVWVIVNDEPECLAVVGPPPPAPNGAIVIFFDGDVATERIADDNSPQERARYERLSRAVTDTSGIPMVVIGRPGLMGSTGVHVNGGRRDEAELMMEAVDAVKQRYGATRLALAGQSGGARIAAQLLVLGRRDVVCTAMASGGYDVPGLKGGGRLATNIFGDPGRGYLVPLQRIGDIERSGARRDYIIGDPRDQQVSFQGQRAFADALQRAGHRATIIEASGSGQKYHGLAIEGIRAAAACARGADDAAVRAAALAKR